jgi:hypothetical protein
VINTSFSRILPGIALALAAAVAHARIEPVGAWSCVVYGQDRESDERMLLDLRADGGTSLARLGSRSTEWIPLSYWNQKRGLLSFSDSRQRREFQADLDYPSLGGIWTGEQFNGGWWCAPLGELPELSPRIGAFNEYTVMPRLIVETMASPWYPRDAIRGAREGYAVACFLVQPDGFVTDVHFLELSDKIFEQPALGALHRSHYQSWDNSLPSRPACRTFDFNLDGKRF